MPLYLVKHPGKDAARERLIEAPNKAAARSFAARGLIDVELAKSSDCFRIARDGGDIEVVSGAEAADEEEAQASPEARQPDSDAEF